MPLTTPHCRACAAPLEHVVADLGVTPLANSYIAPEDFSKTEPCYPLHVYICTHCWLMQISTTVTPESIFSDYAYFSSYSSTWRAHCVQYMEMMRKRLSLNSNHQVIEIASNDGTLLEAFKSAGIPILGVEPAENVAARAVQAGLNVKSLFFKKSTAEELKQQGYMADLIIANNVLAHVPDIHDFIAGFALLLKEGGTATFEFPHLVELLRNIQFDTIYHEHFSYLSLTALIPLFRKHGLEIIDVEKIKTHGGSLRIYVMHARKSEVTSAVRQMLLEEETFGIKDLKTYLEFGRNIIVLKKQLLETLEKLHSEGKRIAAYGAPAKGNTLLNYCGINTRLVSYTVDLNPVKQGKFLPGSCLPIHRPEYLLEDKPDAILILPWNIADEIMKQMAAAREWGAQFIVAIPTVRFY